jgi:1-acyl-sn-glycerol-3-phosphate acyltransferase
MNVLGWLARIYFNKIFIKGDPKNLSTLYLSNHRNGAVDGFVLSYVLGKKTKFIVGKNLTKNWFMRLFFGGQIEVYRKSETPEESKHNKEQLEYAANLIKEGTPVVVFPEGTSDLNPGLLPIKKGAALIVRSLGGKKVVPIGLHYERGWSFRSNVYVNIGEPVEVEGRNLTDKTESIKSHLESVYSDDHTFEVPKKNIFLTLLFTPIVLGFFLFNLIALVVPYITGKVVLYLAAKKSVDDSNVVCLFRLLTGTPAFILQFLIYIYFFICFPTLLPIYVLFTVIGLLVYRKWKDGFGLN